MKNLTFFLVAGLAFLTSGCIDIVEELFLNKDGSGTYAVRYDMSSMFEDGFMKMMLDQAMESEEATADGIGALEEEMDTVMYFKDHLDKVRDKVERPEFWEKVQMRVKMSESESTFYSVIEFEFDEVEEIEYFYKDLDKAMEDEGQEDEMMSGMNSNIFSYALEKKKLIRTVSPIEKEGGLMDEEGMEMMMGFLGDATHKSIIHLPGKVKSTTVDKATIDGKVVTIEHSMADFLKNEADLSGSIKFK